MRYHATVYETEPGHPLFDARAVVKHLVASMDMFVRPQGLVSYWNQEKNRRRRQLLSDQQLLDLCDAFQAKLKELRDAEHSKSA